MLLDKYYLSIIRGPNQENSLNSDSGYTMMPYLAGNDSFGGQDTAQYLQVSDTQYFFLQQWAAGKFDNGPEQQTETVADAITRGVLENCVGGSFSPGIEMTWICENPEIYSEPFRLKKKKNIPYPLSLGMNMHNGLEPGDCTKFMAILWQADFNECSSQPIGERVLWWWPSQRSSFVYIPTEDGDRKQVTWVGIDYNQNAENYIMFPEDIEMVEKWQELGFVFNVGSDNKPDFIEIERTLPRVEEPAIGG